MAVFFSAFFSGSETALISASRIKIEVLARRAGRKGLRHNGHRAGKTREFLSKPEQFLTTTLVGTNIAVVAASSLMAYYLETIMSGFAITVVSSVILLLFGEIIPKSIAWEKAAAISLRIAPPIRFFFYLFYPLIRFVLMISNLLLRLFGIEQGSVRQFFTRRDLEMLVREGEKAGLMSREETRIICRLLLRGKERVKEIMIPRTDAVIVKHDEDPARIMKIFEQTGYTRLPVMGENIDEIKGMVTAIDMILERPDSLEHILRKVLYIPESRRLGSLLREMQETHLSMAIIVDEYGGTAGLVTLEDIVEEYFGEIHDEHDESTSLYRIISERKIEVRAKVAVDELNRRFGLNLTSGEYQTLGGFLMDRLGHIPKRGELVETREATYRILSSRKKTALWVRVIRKPKTGQEK